MTSRKSKNCDQSMMQLKLSRPTFEERCPLKVLRFPRILLIVMNAVVIYCVCNSSGSAAAANPQAVAVPVKYRNTANGMDKSASYSVPAADPKGGWEPQQNPWNNTGTPPPEIVFTISRLAGTGLIS